MNPEEVILRFTGASEAQKIEHIQSLWSGYGSILRYKLTGCSIDSVIIKHVHYNHLGSSNQDLSHQRKLQSYEVETQWYRKYSDRCDSLCRIPRCYGADFSNDEVVLVMEDLDNSGFSARRRSVTDRERNLCLNWLAHFHGRFLGENPRGLWQTGCYWHLETRPEELALLKDRKLKSAAPLIDKILKASPYQTLVHGDAKLANFCFFSDSSSVAAVDFQYVGGGCGMKDLAYFLGSCYFDDDCEKILPGVLDLYFSYLKDAVNHYDKQIGFNQLEEDWRRLFPYAWVDFHRFLKGWSPGHWERDSFSERLTRQVLSELL